MEGALQELEEPAAQLLGGSARMLGQRPEVLHRRRQREAVYLPLPLGAPHQQGELAVVGDQHLAVVRHVAGHLFAADGLCHHVRHRLHLDHAAERKLALLDLTFLRMDLALLEEARVRDPGASAGGVEDADHLGPEPVAHFVQQRLEAGIAGGLRHATGMAHGTEPREIALEWVHRTPE
jgi:hypothetical protein